MPKSSKHRALYCKAVGTFKAEGDQLWNDLLTGVCVQYEPTTDDCSRSSQNLELKLFDDTIW